MRTISTVLILLTLAANSPKLSAQTSGNDIRATVLAAIPDVNLDNKILFINAWKISDYESRQNSKEFNRVTTIYKNAKLKHGRKGVVFINLSLDSDPSAWKISVQKDSIQCDYNLENSSGKYNSILQILNNSTGNIIVNNAGEILAKDLKKDNCFTLFNSQITR